MKCHIRNLNKRKLFAPKRKETKPVARGGDENYGEIPDVPDLDEKSLKIETLAHMCSITVQSNGELEEVTRGLATCERLRYEHNKRIPSSFF